MVRILAIVVAGLVVAVAGVAAAESGEELRARGEQLAKDGRYSEAIVAFKAAEKVEPRARHSCLIALAYTRRELWPQAEIFLEQCETRATAGDPVPEWLPVAKKQLADRLAAVHVAPVDLRVEPVGADAKLAVSSFAPDELFSPRTIHLPPGRHVVIATASGYADAQQTIEITDASPRTVTITMRPEPRPVAVVTHDAGASRASRVPLAVMGAGAGIGLVGLGVHLLVYWPARKDLAKIEPGTPAYVDAEAAWSSRRSLTIGLYAAGAATVITGAVLKATVFKNVERAPQVAIEPREGGGVLSLGWTR